jgi:hypothetical protein
LFSTEFYKACLAFHTSTNLTAQVPHKNEKIVQNIKVPQGVYDNLVLRSAVDPQLANPYHFDPEPGHAFHFDADPDPTSNSDPYPDPTFFQFDADLDLTTHFFPDLDLQCSIVAL